MKRILSVLLAAALCLSLAGCSDPAGAEPTKLRFSDSVDFSAIERLAGKQVSITGYMSTLSPLSGSFIYLLNLPYQSCPFCLPNTTQLSNTMAVYAPKGKAFSYTDQAVRVVGTIELGNFSDEYGYTYNYRIVDAALEAVDLSGISKDYALWQSVAEDGAVAEVNAMFDYLMFLCQWNEYQGGTTFEDGTTEHWYLYPGDVENYLADTGPFGYAKWAADDYYAALVKRLRAISPTGLEDLVSVVQDAEALAKYARLQLSSGNYRYDEAADKYTLVDAQGLNDRLSALYLRFSECLSKWEL